MRRKKNISELDKNSNNDVKANNGIVIRKIERERESLCIIIIVVQITDLPSRYDGDKGVQVCVYMRVIQDELIGFYWKFRAWGDYGICTSFFRNPNPLE